MLLYTVLVLPAIYIASKLSTHSGILIPIVSMVLLPLPVVVTWVYVLVSSSGCGQDGLQRSNSAIMHAYQSPDTGFATQHSRSTGGALRSSDPKHRAATLALLGDVGDNPTLIIRDRKPGEEEFDQFFLAGESSEELSDEETQPQVKKMQLVHGSSAGVEVQQPTVAGRPWKAPTFTRRGQANFIMQPPIRQSSLPGQSYDGGKTILQEDASGELTY
jgi:hypothetical protein